MNQAWLYKKLLTFATVIWVKVWQSFFGKFVPWVAWISSIASILGIYSLARSEFQKLGLRLPTSASHHSNQPLSYCFQAVYQQKGLLEMLQTPKLNQKTLLTFLPLLLKLRPTCLVSFSFSIVSSTAPLVALEGLPVCGSSFSSTYLQRMKLEIGHDFVISMPFSSLYLTASSTWYVDSENPSGWTRMQFCKFPGNLKSIKCAPFSC